MAVEPNRAKAIFLEAVDKAPAERTAFVDQTCTGDEDLRHRVELLLHAHDGAFSLLDRPAAEQFPASACLVKDGSLVDGGTPQPELPDAPTESECDGDDVLAYLDPAREPGGLGRLAHYEALEILGRGGFGTVLKSFDEKLHRIVAIKVLAPALAASGTARQRFLREARAAAAVRDEHVIDIHVVGEKPLPYLVMEYIDGQTLQEKLDKTGPLPIKEILRIGYQVAAGLAAAHKQGLIHRDVKPSNILLENGLERVKLSDFGLARLVNDASLTQSGLIAGTPMFMSPEQAEGQHVDHRSDLFSLGSVLYALCTGHPPFRGSSTLSVLKRVCENNPSPIRDVNPEIPDELAAVVNQLLAKEPGDRFQSARELADRLAGFLSELQIHGQMLPTNSGPTEQVIKSPSKLKDGPAPLAEPMRRAVYRSPRLLASLAVGIGAIVLAVLLFHEQWGKPLADGKKNGAAPALFANPSEKRTPKEISIPLLARVGDGDPELAAAGLVAMLGDGRFNLSGERVGQMAAAPDSRLVAVPCGGHVFLFEAKSGRFVRKITAHNQFIRRITFSADSKRMVTASEDSTARLLDVEDGKLVQTFHGHNSQVLAAIFGPDNNTVITGSADNTVRVWDAVTGKQLQQPLLHPAHVHGLALSPDGKSLVTGCNDRNVRVWDFASGDLKQTLPGHTGKVVSVCFSADGKWLATGSEELKLWNAATFQIVHTLPTASHWLSFGQAGHTVLASKLEHKEGEAYVVSQWEVATGKKLPELTLKNQGDWASFGLTADGKTLLAARSSPNPDVFVRAYDTQTGRELFSPRHGHAGQVRSVAFSPNENLLASGGDDKTVRIWELGEWRDGEALPPVRILTGHVQTVGSVKFSPDGKLLASGSLDRTIVVWDVATGKKVQTLKGHSSKFSRMAFSPDGQTIAAGQENGAVNFWDVASGKSTSTPLTGHSPVPCVAYSPDGKLLACGGSDKTIQVYQVDTQQLVKTLTLSGSVAVVTFSHDGQWLAAATDDKPSAFGVWEVSTWKAATLPSLEVRGIVFSPVAPLLASCGVDGSVRFWDLKDDGPRTFTAALGRFNAAEGELAFTSDGRYLAVGGDNGEVAILPAPPPPPPYSPGPRQSAPKDLAKMPSAADALDPLAIPKELLAQAAVMGQPPAGLVAVLGGKDGHAGQVFSVAIRPDGKILASAGQDNTVRLWDLATGKLREQWTLPQTYAYCVSFSADNHLLVSGSGNGDIDLRDAETGKLLRTWIGHNGRVNSVAISPDRRVLASAGNDGAVRLWDAETGKLLRVLDKWAQPTWCVVFSPDGKTVASGLADGVVRLWDVATGWEVVTLKGHMTVWIRALAFSPDGQTLATSGFHSGDPIRLWDLAERKHRTLPAAQATPVIVVRWDAAGRLLATASDSDGMVRVWDTTTNPPQSRVLQVIPAGQRWLHGLAFTPEGRHLATANPDGTIYILRLAEPGAIVEITGADR